MYKRNKYYSSLLSLPQPVLRRCVGTLLLSSALSSSLISGQAFAQQDIIADDIDEIIVTGSPLVRSADEVITGVSVLTGEELANRLSGTIGETLKTEPGVSSTFFGVGASRPIIRGQDGDRVRVLDNGIGSIDASSFSPDHAVATEPAQAERIEVIRGASVLRFGSSGAGGIVNVIDGRIPQALPEGGYDGAIRVGGSTVDDGIEVAGAIDAALGQNFVLHLDGTFRDTDDFDIPGFAVSDIAQAEAIADGADPDEVGGDFGTLTNSAVETSAFSGGLSYIGERGFFGVSIRQFDSEYGIQEEGEEGEEEEEGEEGEEGEEEAPFIDLDQFRIDVRGRLELDGFFESLDVFAGYADYEQFEFEAPGEAGALFANDGGEARIELVQAENNGWQGAYGFQVRIRNFEAISFEDDSSFIPPSLTQQYGIYTFQEKELGNIHLELGARYENSQIRNDTTNFDRDFNAFSISGGADYHLNDQWRIGATAFRTQRAPSAEELFTDGVHLATGQFEIGDDTLGLETARGGEIALRYRGETNFLTVNGFVTSYNDYVFGAETGEFEEGLPVFQFQADDATFRGAEVQVGQDIGYFAGFDIKADGLLEFVRATTEGGNLPRIPPLSGLIGVSAENDNWNLRAELDIASSQDNTAEFELPTEGYQLVNLFLTYKFDVAENPLNFRVSVHNLFDDDARQHTSFLKDALPLPGRNVRFSLALNF